MSDKPFDFNNFIDPVGFTVDTCTDGIMKNQLLDEGINPNSGNLSAMANYGSFIGSLAGGAFFGPVGALLFGAMGRAAGYSTATEENWTDDRKISAAIEYGNKQVANSLDHETLRAISIETRKAINECKSQNASEVEALKAVYKAGSKISPDGMEVWRKAVLKKGREFGLK